jgi:hypothetical protein
MNCHANDRGGRLAGIGLGVAAGAIAAALTPIPVASADEADDHLYAAGNFPFAAGAAADDPDYTILSNGSPTDGHDIIPYILQTFDQQFAVYDAAAPDRAELATGQQAGTEELEVTRLAFLGFGNTFYSVTDAGGSLAGNAGDVADIIGTPFGDIPIINDAFDLPDDFPGDAADISLLDIL